jgi:hypothetical protein
MTTPVNQSAPAPDLGYYRLPVTRKQMCSWFDETIWCRPPDARWQNAQKLAQKAGFSPRHGRAANHLASFLRQRQRLERGESDESAESFTRRYAALIEAEAIYKAEGLRKWTLEARILARQSPREIARAMRLSLHVVRTYEAVFFHVADRLDASVYIHTYVIGNPLLSQPVAEDDAEFFLKRFAYLGGTVGLEMLLPLAGQMSADLRTLPPELQYVAIHVRLFARQTSVPDFDPATGGPSVEMRYLTELSRKMQSGQRVTVEDLERMPRSVPVEQLAEPPAELPAAAEANRPLPQTAQVTPAKVLPVSQRRPAPVTSDTVSQHMMPQQLRLHLGQQ